MLWAVLYGYLIFSDLPHWWTLVGSLVIAGSGLYILWRETRRPSGVNPGLTLPP
jgi:drug/metabolite transporter (DMT)-like permease